jgi:hypothetical protein
MCKLLCRIKTHQGFFAHRTTLNGHSFRHFPTTQKCFNSGRKTIVAARKRVKKGFDYVFTATTDPHGEGVANLSYWH